MPSAGLSENALQNMFAYLNARRNANKISVNNGNKYNYREELIFGEELNTYFPTNGEMHYSVMERDPLYGVRALSGLVTTEIYGEPRLVNFITGVYNDLVASRLKRGFKGVRGKNMKGLICAIIYIIVLYEEGSNLTVNAIVKAANRVKSKATVKITDKMVNRYIPFVVDNLTVYKKINETMNNNNNSQLCMRHVEADVKRLGLLLQYSTNDIFAMKRIVRSLPCGMFEDHLPRTVAGGVVFWYTKYVKTPAEYVTNNAVLKRISVSRAGAKKITDKLKNVSLHIR